MNAIPPSGSASPQPPRVWVESLGGPLIVVPVTSLAGWGGCTESGTVMGDPGAPDDYDRACQVEGLAGLLAVAGAGTHALVLADEPASTTYLPGHRTFLRWLAADSEADLIAAAEAVLADPASEWETCGTWVTDGPAVLMDSTTAGNALGVEFPDGGFPEQAVVPLPAGTWTVRAVHARPGESASVGLVQLLPAGT